MIAVIPYVANLDAGRFPNLLLDLKTVLFICGLVDVFICVEDDGRCEVRVSRADRVIAASGDDSLNKRLVCVCKRVGEAAGLGRIGESRRVKSHIERRIGKQIVGDCGGKDVGEQAESAAQNGVGMLVRRPGEAESRIDGNGLKMVEGLMKSVIDGAVIWSIESGRDVRISIVQASETMYLADWIRIVFDAKTGSHLEVEIEKTTFRERCRLA